MADDKKRKKNKPGQGRPRSLNETKIQELLDSLWRGSDIIKACKDVQICQSTFYNEYHRNPDFQDKVAHVLRARKTNASIIAHQTVVKAMQKGDAHIALDYLKNTDPDFSTKSENRIRADIETRLTLEERKEAALAWAMGEDNATSRQDEASQTKIDSM